MKALILKKYNILEVEDIETPSCGVDEVIIRVKACAICGSDVHGMDGSTGRRIPPVIMGHEAAGVIEETGEAVSNFKPGDRVTFDSTIYCGQCDYCRSDMVNLCGNRKVLGVSCDEYRLNGAFAELVAVPTRVLYRLPDSVSYQQAAMIEPLSVAYHAVTRVNPLPSDITVVIGAGTIGILIIQVLKAMGVRQVIAIDTLEGKLELAKNAGANQVIHIGDEGAKKAIAELVDSEQVDIVFDAVGIQSTFTQCVQLLKKGGKGVLVGNLAKDVVLPLQKTVVRQLSFYGSCASAGEYDQCIKLIAAGKINVDALISAAIPLEDAACYFKRLYNKEQGLNKVIVLP